MHWSARIVMLLLLLAPEVSEAQALRLSATGYGPVRVGMTPEDASERLGTPLVKVLGTYQDDRYIVRPKHGHAGIAFTVSGAGTIDGFYVAFDARGIKTDRDLHVGSSANEVWRKYRSQMEVKAYQCGSPLLIYTYRSPRDPRYGVIYEVGESGLVQGISGGDLSTKIPLC